MSLATCRDRFSRCLTIAAAVAIAGPLMAVLPAAAQDFPTRPIRLVVPSAAGGGLDIIGRLIAQKITELRKYTIYVENRPGANFAIGLDAVARAEPDGYSMVFTSTAGVTLNPHIFNMTSNPLRDLKPVIMVSSSPFALILNNSVPAKSTAEFVSYLRANPGKLNHAFNSATTRMVSELFKSQAKVDYVDVHYRGAPLALAATQAGTTQFAFVDIGTARSAVEGKLVRALALSVPKRHDLNPDIPTLTESGYPINVSAYTALLVPAATPEHLVNTLHTIVKEALTSADVVKRLNTIGSTVAGYSPEATSQILNNESKQWSTLIKTRNIKFGS